MNILTNCRSTTTFRKSAGQSRLLQHSWDLLGIETFGCFVLEHGQSVIFTVQLDGGQWTAQNENIDNNNNNIIIDFYSAVVSKDTEALNVVLPCVY